MYLTKDSGINTVEDFKAIVIGIINNIGLKATVVKNNVTITIP